MWFLRFFEVLCNGQDVPAWFGIRLMIAKMWVLSFGLV